MRKLVASGLSKDDWVVNAEELRFVLEDTTRRTLIAMCELMATAATNPEWKDKTIGEGIVDTVPKIRASIEPVIVNFARGTVENALAASGAVQGAGDRTPFLKFFRP
jgi:hypothetical protein